MKVGDLVTTIEPALGPTGDDFGTALVVGTRTIAEKEVELLFSDGETDWYPAWMMKVINESR